MPDNNGVRPHELPHGPPGGVAAVQAIALFACSVQVLPADAREAGPEILHGDGREDEAVDQDVAGEVIDQSDADEFGVATCGGAHFAVDGDGEAGVRGWGGCGRGVYSPLSFELAWGIRACDVVLSAGAGQC